MCTVENCDTVAKCCFMSVARTKSMTSYKVGGRKEAWQGEHRDSGEGRVG